MLTKKIKAGNVNNKNSFLSCAAGVDCSGLISQTWGLNTKLGTSDIAGNNYTEEISEGELRKGDVLVIAGFHVMMYETGLPRNTIYVIESHGPSGMVIRQKYPLDWLIEEMKYKPRRVKTPIVCKN